MPIEYSEWQDHARAKVLEVRGQNNHLDASLF
jgi:hypothetical protein